MNLDFSNVEEPNIEKADTYKVVKSGAQKLVIAAVESGNSASGTPFVEVTFESEKYGASFKHKFFTTEKAMPRLLQFIQTLTGSKPGKDFNTDSLIGKEGFYIVDGQDVQKQVGGKTYTNTYPTLRYAGFVQPLDTPEEKKFVDSMADIKAATPLPKELDLNSKNGDDDDLPF